MWGQIYISIECSGKNVFLGPNCIYCMCDTSTKNFCIDKYLCYKQNNIRSGALVDLSKVYLRDFSDYTSHKDHKPMEVKMLFIFFISGQQIFFSELCVLSTMLNWDIYKVVFCVMCICVFASKSLSKRLSTYKCYVDFIRTRLLPPCCIMWVWCFGINLEIAL